jgi:GNAT superfamily N-acetyltransferase
MTVEVIESGDGAAFDSILDEVTEVYLAARRDQAHAKAALYTREAFLDRTTLQLGRDGFGATWARVGGELVGFAFGLPLGPGRWWSGNATPPPREMDDVAKFAVIELDVVPQWRSQGIARRLMRALLDGRPEPYAVLTTTPGTPARAMYDRWGWRKVGTAQHAPDAPVMDTLVRRLSA